jgi:predicted ATPase/DNA-binding CsgD family transcriptional regulator
MIGREQDAAAVRRALLETDGRIVTLTGPGGCGKTRLALGVAADLVDSFADGVRLVELAPAANPLLVPQAVATALGVQEQPPTPTLDRLVASLKSRELLLVLDNCEHLVEACAHLADAVVAGCPKVRVLATSRERLGVQGEITWRVPPLPVPDLSHARSVDELARSPSVQLFVDRARAVRTVFSLTAQNGAAVAQICRQLDGLPLGIELAAAMLASLGVDQLLERLSTHARMPVGGSRTAPSRHQTMHATLDWSYGWLTPAEQAVFRRLSVFAGSFSLEAAEAVCLGDAIIRIQVLELLSRLVDKSLIAMDEYDGRARYRMLEPVRQYALERLAATGELAATQERHASFFLALAEQWAGWTLGTRSLGSEELELDNFRSALRWCVEHGAADTGLRMARGCMGLWIGRGAWDEARAWLNQLLDLPAAEQPTVARAAALGCSGFIAARHGDFARAREDHEQGLATARLVGDLGQVFSNLHDAGWGALYRGEYAFARQWFGEAVATARMARDRLCESWGLCCLGFVAYQEADAPLAGTHGEEALSLARTVDEPWVIGCALNLLSYAAFAKGDLGAARRLADQSLTLLRQVGHQLRMAYTLDALGHIALVQAQHAEAKAQFAECLTVYQETRDAAGIAQCLDGFAAVAAAQVQTDRAIRLVAAAAALRECIGAPLHPLQRERRDGWLGPLRRTVGEDAFTQSWARGHALMIEEAVALALGDSEPAVCAASTNALDTQPSSPLSPREQEVAGLLGEGLSNRQIAERLVITPRTVAAHIEHILDKLGFTSRTQIALWAAEHSLVRQDPA